MRWPVLFFVAGVTLFCSSLATILLFLPMIVPYQSYSCSFFMQVRTCIGLISPLYFFIFMFSIVGLLLLLLGIFRPRIILGSVLHGWNPTALVGSILGDLWVLGLKSVRIFSSLLLPQPSTRTRRSPARCWNIADGVEGLLLAARPAALKVAVPVMIRKALHHRT